MMGLLRAAPIVLGAACCAIAAAQGSEMRVTMVTIDYDKMRYPTVGDWQFDKRGNLKITVARLSDRRYETLVAVHELIEAVLCRQAGVSQRDVDAFDIEYEKQRAEILSQYRKVSAEHKRQHGFEHLPLDDTIVNVENAEPGDDPSAPYHEQHVAATWFEKQLAIRLGVDWEAYNKEVESK
jgi:hypothetical protein